MKRLKLMPLCEWPFDDPALQGARAALGLGKLAIPCYCKIGDVFSGITRINPGMADSVVSAGRHGTCEPLNAFRKTCACCTASPRCNRRPARPATIPRR
jgi:hypothetical protein